MTPNEIRDLVDPLCGAFRGEVRSAFYLKNNCSLNLNMVQPACC